MSTLDVFTCPVVYKYRTRYCTFSAFIVFASIVVTIIFPLLIVYHAGGFWLKSRVYVESPVVNFVYKYFLVAEKQFPADPIVCSTFSTYLDNEINDDCLFFEAHQVDVNKDRRDDVLKFEASFFSDEPIKTLRLLLFFNIELEELIASTIETVTLFDYAFNHEFQNVTFIGDLKLQQRGLLRIDSFPESYNYSIEFGDKSIIDLLFENARNKLSARLANTQVMWETGFADDEPITVNGEIFYSEELIHYQPGFWEELKWAWIQYLSVFLVFSYISTRILNYLFTNGRLRGYIIVPWKVE